MDKTVGRSTSVGRGAQIFKCNLVLKLIKLVLGEGRLSIFGVFVQCFYNV